MSFYYSKEVKASQTKPPLVAANIFVAGVVS
jgi:hypothetical protein